MMGGGRGRVEIQNFNPWIGEDMEKLSTPCSECDECRVLAYKEGTWCRNCGATFRALKISSEAEGSNDS